MRPSIKYVTLHRGRGSKMCDSLWQGNGEANQFWRHTIYNCYKYFFHGGSNFSRGVEFYCSPLMEQQCSVVIAAYDFESSRPGSNILSGDDILWGFDHCSAGLTRPEPSSLRGSTLGIGACWLLNIKDVTWSCKLIDGCSLELYVFGHTFSGIIWHMPRSTEIKSIQLHDCIAMASAMRYAT